MKKAVRAALKGQEIGTPGPGFGVRVEDSLFIVTHV
jgi:hypothetical protein